MDYEKGGKGPLKPDWGNDPTPERIAPTPKSSGRRIGMNERHLDTSGSDWKCLGVAQKRLKLIGSEHELPMGSAPDQPTTDESGDWQYGYCPTCAQRTIWRKV